MIVCNSICWWLWKPHGSLDFSSRYGSLRRLILDCPVFRQNKGEKRYNFSKLVNMKNVLHDDTHLVHFLSVDHLTMALPFNTIRNNSPSHAAYRSQQRVSYSHTCHHKNNKSLHSWIWCVELLLPIQPWDSCNDRLFLKKKVKL